MQALFLTLLIITLLTATRSLKAAMAGKPKLIGFDLDGTIWSPDMYELWGGGAPFAGDGTGTMKDRSGETVRLLGSVREILTELKHNPDWADTKVAWVSCTDEPSWAEELLGKFKLNSGEPIGTVIHSSQIYKANKTTHFRNLQKEFPDIAFEDMLFYDNEMGNIRSVSTLGVKCVYCPRGVTADAWSEGMKQFK